MPLFPIRTAGRFLVNEEGMTAAAVVRKRRLEMRWDMSTFLSAGRSGLSRRARLPAGIEGVFYTIGSDFRPV